MRPQFGVSIPPLPQTLTPNSPLTILTKQQSFLPSTSIIFVSQASIDTGTVQSYSIRKRIEAVKNCRNIGKRDMKFNAAMPKMHVDPESYVVEADEMPCVAEPSGALPLAQDFYVY